jgi:hypothetical protein
MRATTRPALPGFMPSNMPTVVNETSEIEILKRQYDTRLNRNGKGTQRSAIAASDEQRRGIRRKKSAVRHGPAKTSSGCGAKHDRFPEAGDRQNLRPAPLYQIRHNPSEELLP